MFASRNWVERACKLALGACMALACGGRVERSPEVTAASGAAGRSVIASGGRNASSAGAAGATPCDVVAYCPNGGCCVRGFCVAEGERCEGVGPCMAGHCTECGELGKVCCPGASSANCGGLPYHCNDCSDSDAICGFDSTCQACGHDGQQCCGLGCRDTPSACVFPDALHGDTTCTTQCGQAGEPCCDDVGCIDGSCCLTDPSGKTRGTCLAAPTCGCDAGNCTTCGAQGLPCCDQGTCLLGLGCSAPDTTGTCGVPRKR